MAGLLIPMGSAFGQTHRIDYLQPGLGEGLESYGRVIDALKLRAAGSTTKQRANTLIRTAEFLTDLLSRPALTVSMQPPGNPNASGDGMNLSCDGTTTVGRQDSGLFTPFHAFRWTQSGGPVDLGTLVPANNASRSSLATGVNSDGSIVVGVSEVAATSHAFRWTAGTGMVDLGAPAGASRFSRAWAISCDGTVIVGDAEFADGAFFRNGAFRWTSAAGGTFEPLGALVPGFPSVATSVSDDGGVIVGQASVPITVGNTQTNGSRAFRWTRATGMTSIGALPGHPYAAATAVSGDGRIVVGTSSSTLLTLGATAFNTGSAVFRWTEADGMQDLRELLVVRGVDMTGVSLVAATGISPDGQWVLGKATTPQTGPNETVPFLAQICDAAIGGPCSTRDAATFSIGASSGALTVAAGQSATTDITIAAIGGFSGQIGFACSGLPVGANCSFSPAMVTATGASVTTRLTISTDGGPLAVLGTGGSAAAVALALTPLAFIGLAGGSGRRRAPGNGHATYALLLGGLLLLSIAACGGGGGGGGGDAAMGGSATGGGSTVLGSGGGASGATGTPAGTSQVIVTATSGSGTAATAKTLQLTLTVTR